MLEKTLRSPLDCKEIQPVHSEGDQSRVFFGRNDAETPVLWPPHVKSWLIGKDSDAGRDWGQEEKAMTEDEMAGWHHWLDGRWVWVNSGSWWWTGRPGVLQFMGSQRVGNDWATELNIIMGVLIRKQEGQREDDVTLAAEVGVTSFEDGGRGHKPKNTGYLQKLEKIRFYSKPSRKNLPCQHHDKPSKTCLASLPFRTIKE